MNTGPERRGLRYSDEFREAQGAGRDRRPVPRWTPVISALSPPTSPATRLNNRLLRELLARRDAWEMVSFERQEDAPQALIRLFAQPA